MTCSKLVSVTAKRCADGSALVRRDKQVIGPNGAEYLLEEGLRKPSVVGPPLQSELDIAPGARRRLK